MKGRPIHYLCAAPCASQVYIVGGDYVDGGAGKALVSCYDFTTGLWSNVDAPFDPEVLRALDAEAPPNIAFIPVYLPHGALPPRCPW